MSKRTKVLLGIVVSVIVIAAILVGAAGFVISRNRNFRAIARQPQRATQLDVQLLDEDKDGIPDRAVAALPGRGGYFNRGFSDQAAQLDVQLIDDDGDGVPDRGLLDFPAGRAFERGFGPDRGFGRGFDPGRGLGRFASSRFGPFIILGGLFRLAVLAGLVVLGIALYRRWRPSPSSPPAPVDVGPDEPEPDESMPTEHESPPADSLEADPDGPSGVESAPPEEDDQPKS